MKCLVWGGCGSGGAGEVEGRESSWAQSRTSRTSIAEKQRRQQGASGQQDLGKRDRCRLL